MDTKKKIIFDVDTGSDDTIAMLLGILAPEKFDVLGICSVNGNRGVEYTTDVKPRQRPMPRPYEIDRSGSMSGGWVNREYLTSTDQGARARNRAEADRVMMDQQRRERERERDRQNEEEFERYYALRQRLNGRSD